jgi:Retinal pigment epithelial membrane protein
MNSFTHPTEPATSPEPERQEKPGFPRAVLSVSREEFYGQDPQHQPLELTVRDGKTGTETQLPKDLQGHVFIIGPAGSVASPPASQDEKDRFVVLPTQDGWTPLFNGDGTIYRLDFHEVRGGSGFSSRSISDKTPQKQEPGKAWLTTRLVKIPSFYADEITHTSYPQLQFSNLGFTRFSLRLGFCNQVNTAFLSMCDRLLVTNDASRAFEIDPRSLKVLAPVGSNREWSQPSKISLTAPFVFPTIESSAHPCCDRNTGEMFTVRVLKSDTTLFGTSHLFKVAGTSVWRTIFEIVTAPLWLLFDLFVWVLQALGLLGEDALYLVRWQGKDSLQQWKVLLPNGKPVKIQQTTHMLGLTQKYVVIADTGLKIALEDILPSALILKAQKWLETIERDFDRMDENAIAKIVQEKFQTILKWFRETLTEQQLPNNQVYIVPREQLKYVEPGKSIQAQSVTIEGSFYHFLTDYEETPDGKIVIHAAMSYATDPGEFIHKDDESVYFEQVTHQLRQLSGAFTAGMDVNNIAAIAIDPEKGEAKKHELTLEEAYQNTFFTGLYAYRDDLPTQKFEDIYWFGGGAWSDMMTKFVSQMYRDYPYRQLPIEKVLDAIKEQIPVRLCRCHIDRDSDKIVPAIADYYEFPQEYFANSPQFVPSADKEGATQGYIVCVVIHSNNFFSDREASNGWSNNSELWIFDANNLARGPLYKLSHPKLNFSLTIHTTWLSELVSPPASNYKIREDFDWLVSGAVKHYPEKIGKQIQELFDKIYEQFENEKSF